jgi:hypothetical protein
MRVTSELSLGVLPAKVFYEHGTVAMARLDACALRRRYLEVLAAIARYKEAGIQPLSQWLAELDAIEVEFASRTRARLDNGFRS